MTEPDFDREYESDPDDPGPGEAVEQARPIDPIELPAEVHRGLEVDEADALDQAREVPLDEDDEETT